MLQIVFLTEVMVCGINSFFSYLLPTYHKTRTKTKKRTLHNILSSFKDPFDVKFFLSHTIFAVTDAPGQRNIRSYSALFFVKHTTVESTYCSSTVTHLSPTLERWEVAWLNLYFIQELTSSPVSRRKNYFDSISLTPPCPAYRWYRMRVGIWGTGTVSCTSRLIRVWKSQQNRTSLSRFSEAQEWVWIRERTRWGGSVHCAQWTKRKQKQPHCVCLLSVALAVKNWDIRAAKGGTFSSLPLAVPTM